MWSRSFFLFLALGFINACTPPVKPEEDLKFKFNAKVAVQPLKKIVHIGDTIWLDYAAQNALLKDDLTGTEVNADSLTSDFSVSFNPIHSPAAQDPYCSYVWEGAAIRHDLKGQFGTGLEGVFICKSSSLTRRRIGIVPLKKGIYGIFLPESLLIGTGCAAVSSGFPFSGIRYRFGVNDANKDIYLSIPPGTLPEEVPKGSLARWIDEKRVFVVKVE